MLKKVLTEHKPSAKLILQEVYSGEYLGAMYLIKHMCTLVATKPQYKYEMYVHTRTGT